jgi:hypothetical protein
VTFYSGSFSAFTSGSRFFIERTTANFSQDTRFLARAFKTTKSYIEWLVFTYFNYRHVPLTSIEIGLLLANRQPSQNGAEFYFNGYGFVKHRRN